MEDNGWQGGQGAPNRGLEQQQQDEEHDSPLFKEDNFRLW
jgi:hypothetical protein